MPAAPLVSVVMPCFNQGRFIAEAIASVHAQTVDDVEIVVVEDCSTDGFTRDVVRTLSCARTTTILHDVNRGVAAARNTGIRAARGVYVLPLDADDRLAPEFVARTLAVLESGRADVVYSRVRYFGTRTGDSAVEPFSVRGMLRHNLVVNTALYRKAAWAEVGGYASVMQAGLEDWEFWLSLLERGNRFLRVESPLFLYRQHGPSRSHSANEAQARLRESIFARHRDLYRRHGFADARQRPRTAVERRLRRLARLTKAVCGWDCAAGRPPAKRPIPLAAAAPRGHALHAAILRRLTGRPIGAATAPDQPTLCMGDALEPYLLGRGVPAPGGPPVAVWGAGFVAAAAAVLHGAADPPAARPLVLHAVRGRLSLARLRALGYDVARTAVGDPALLAGLLVPRTAPRRRFRLGLVPDVADRREPAFTHVRGRLPATRLISIVGPAERFLTSLRECDVVVTSCPHAVAAADALGIPNVHVRVPAGGPGAACRSDDRHAYRFDDYFSAFGVRPPSLALEDLRTLSADDVARIESSCRPDPDAVGSVVAGLLASCPLTAVDADAAAMSRAA